MKTILFFLLSMSGFFCALGQSTGFMPNRGQVADASGLVRKDIFFSARFPGADLYFFKNGFSYVLWEDVSLARTGEETEEMWVRKSHRVDIRFEGANDHAVLKGISPNSSLTNYYYAHCPEGVLNVGGYDSIWVKDLYSGIDLVLTSHPTGLEYDFRIAAGASADIIQMRIDGADSIHLANDQLVLSTSLGPIREHIPMAYLAHSGEEVDCQYSLSGNTIRFESANPQSNCPIIIDPVSTWATYYGGTGIDYGRGVAWNGLIYQAGETASNDFPLTPGVQQTTFGGNRDAYLVQWSMTGNRLWSTYFGGTTLDAAEDVAVSPAGNIIIAGYTSGNLPVSGAYQPAYGGTTDGFVAQFNPSGAMMWSSYVGGEEQDRILDVATDLLNNVVVGGFTSSNFQISTPGVVQAARSGNADAFIVKLDAAGNRVWGTYWGGTGLDEAHGIATDSQNNIVIAGRTYGPFPTGASVGNVVAQSVKAGAFGDMDIFATKISPAGNLRLWSTYYGGPNVERGYDVAVDGADNVIVAGNAWASFPVTAGVVQPTYGGGSGDASVVKFASNGARLFATYLGGSTYDLALSVDAVGTNDIIVGGETNKPFATVNFCQSTCTGTYCGFIVHLNGNGSSRIMSTLLGGSGTFNSVVDVAVDNSSNIFTTGFTSSTNYPVGGTAVFQPAYGGGSADAFMGIYNDDSCRAVILAADAIQLSGTRNGNNVSLHWAATNLVGGGHFEVEQWLPDNSYKPVAMLSVDESSAYSYSFEDPSLGSSAWFRVRLRDLAGAETYSNFVELQDAEQDWEMVLWPNPAADFVQVRFSEDAAPGTLTLFDLTGREMGKWPIQADGGVISVKEIPAGLYLAQLRSDDRVTSALIEVAR